MWNLTGVCLLIFFVLALGTLFSLITLVNVTAWLRALMLMGPILLLIANIDSTIRQKRSRW
jgi:hypothetical protein